MYVAIRNRSCENRSNGWTSWSLARGAIDCAVGGVLSGNINQWYEVADVLFLLPMGWDFQAHVMDLHTWRELEEERQIILTQVFQEAESAFWKMASELTATGISCNTGEVEHCNTGNLGQMSLRELASDEYSEFKRGFVRQSVLPTWVEQCGPDCADLFNATIAQAVGIKAESFAGPTPTPTRQPVPLPTRTRLPTATPTPSPTPTFAGSPTPAPVPQVFFAGAEFVSEGNHGQRITVPVGSKVQVYVTLESNTATVGQLEVHIVSDITLTNDETKRLCGSKVSLEAGLNEILACDFVADQLAGSSLRQYFLKVQWNDDFIYDPQDPETREAVITVPSPTPTPTLFGANAEYQNVITAVTSMMADNNISSLPNPSSLTTGNGTGGCDTGTSLMTAFPDATSVIAVDKVLDPDGGTYVEGVDPLGDKAGFLLFSHDHVAGNDQVSLVNYMSVGSTVFCYQSTADGTITQFDMHGTQTNP